MIPLNQTFETTVVRKTNQQRTASILASWFLSKFPETKSIFDIGCGDGIVSAHLPAGVSYKGIDLGADIYPRSSQQDIAYVEDLPLLEQQARGSGKVDAVFLLDVLEHTPSFTSLFEIALSKANNHVLVSLPNEANLRHALYMLNDRLPGAHGVRMLDYKPGHRHQWLINISQARDALRKVADAHGFRFSLLAHVANESPNAAKRLAFRAATFPLPWRLRCDQFALVFASAAATTNRR